jgi:hypothetical protein
MLREEQKALVGLRTHLGDIGGNKDGSVKGCPILKKGKSHFLCNRDWFVVGRFLIC